MSVAGTVLGVGGTLISQAQVKQEAASKVSSNSSILKGKITQVSLEEGLKLFRAKVDASVAMTFQEISKTNNIWQDIHLAYKEAGISDKITSIGQPTGSVELNSQNFIVTHESGNRLLLRRCCKFQGLARYESLGKMLAMLYKEGVRVPELSSNIRATGFPYYEIGIGGAKTSWVFFKYIDAKKYFSGTSQELSDGAEQIGKLHAALKKSYDKVIAISENGNQADNGSGPFLSSTKWKEYLVEIEEAVKKGGDEYDKAFSTHKLIIEEMIGFVESNHKSLEDASDVQNIHFDLNSCNLVTDSHGHVHILDFDEVRLGNIYTDIGFAFHRLVTTCIEQGDKDIPSIIQAFLTGYKKGNPNFNLDLKKLVVASFNRALRNLRASLEVKYVTKEKDKGWLPSITINILRLKQVKFLTGLAEG